MLRSIATRARCCSLLMLESVAMRPEAGGPPHPSRRALRDAPQRLCSLSSGLPLLFVPEHSVEDGEDLAADGDESNHFWLTDSEQALIEGTQYGIAAAGGKRGQEDRRARDGTTAGYHAPAFPLAGLACERRDASQACDLAAREAAQFGDICQEGASEPIADTRERDQQVLLFTPNRRAAHHGVDVAVDDRQFLLESCNVAREAFAHAHGGGAFLALAFGDQHLDELHPSAHQFSQQASRFIRQLPRLRLHGFRSEERRVGKGEERRRRRYTT